MSEIFLQPPFCQEASVIFVKATYCGCAAAILTVSCVWISTLILSSVFTNPYLCYKVMKVLAFFVRFPRGRFQHNKTTWTLTITIISLLFIFYSSNPRRDGPLTTLPLLVVFIPAVHVSLTALLGSGSASSSCGIARAVSSASCSFSDAVRPSSSE